MREETNRLASSDCTFPSFGLFEEAGSHFHLPYKRELKAEEAAEDLRGGAALRQELVFIGGEPAGWKLCPPPGLGSDVCSSVDVFLLHSRLC